MPEGDSIMACKGRCTPYLAKVKRFIITNSRTGYRVDNRIKYPGLCRCSACDQYLIWEGLFCPCCGIRVCRSVRQKTRSPSAELYKEECRRQTVMLRAQAEAGRNGNAGTHDGTRGHIVHAQARMA